MIDIESKQEVVTCVSCKHSYVSLADLLTSGQRYGKCKRTEQSAMTYDPVTGKTVKSVKIEYCSTERTDFGGYRGECGAEGRHWVPKHSRDVFKALRKI